MPGMKHNLLAGLHFVTSGSHQFRNNYRTRVSRKRAHARVSMGVGAYCVLKDSRAREKNTEVRREHRINRGVEVVVRFERSRTHTEHQIVAIRRGGYRDRRSGAKVDFAVFA